MKFGFFLFWIMLTFLSCESQLKTSIPSNRVTEESEFETLMQKDALDRKQRAAEAVNAFLGGDQNSTTSAILVENNSDCNIILRISGTKTMSVPVEKKGKNYVIVPNGNYQFNARICDAKYQKVLQISDSFTLTLSTN